MTDLTRWLGLCEGNDALELGSTREQAVRVPAPVYLRPCVISEGVTRRSNTSAGNLDIHERRLALVGDEEPLRTIEGVVTMSNPFHVVDLERVVWEEELREKLTRVRGRYEL